MELIYILTYDCNFRCKYCDVYKHQNSMDPTIIEEAYSFLQNGGIKIEKVKFFGGEPLLMYPAIQNIIETFPQDPPPRFYVTTNATLVNKNIVEYFKKRNVLITFSTDGNPEYNSLNRVTDSGVNLSQLIDKNTRQFHDAIRVNQVITSKTVKHFFENFSYLYSIGVRSFNFLPAYYKSWSKTGLLDLKKGFDQILEFLERAEDPITLVNIENHSETSFFNLGIVIDTDGSLYGTNLILSGIFDSYKNDLRIGRVGEGLYVDINDETFHKNYVSLIAKIIDKTYPQSVLKSVQYVDLILNHFCFEWRRLSKEFPNN